MWIQPLTITTRPAQAARGIKAWLKSLHVKGYRKSGGKVRKKDKNALSAPLLKLCLLYWSEGRELGFSHAPEIIYSFAVVVSNSRGLGGWCGGSSRRQVINRTNHPKWGRSLSPFLLFSSCQRWQLFRRKNLYPISPPMLLGFPFHSWPRGVVVLSAAHPSRGGKCIARFESPGQGWYLPRSPFRICSPSPHEESLP